ncbi:MAG: TetR/AcrR family transcriptional regulator [Actinomycetota bacterium]
MSSTASPDTRPGRSAGTRAAILDGAATCFAGAGYGGASMDAIAAAAGVTKPTVYAHFGSKDQLFTELLRDRLDGLDQLPVAAATTDAAIETAIADYALQRMDVMLDETALGLFRAASAEGIRRPDWAAALMGSLGASEFEAWLQTASDAGLLRIDAPAEAAELFWAQLEGALFFPAVIGMIPAPDAPTRSRVVAAAVRSFLCTHGPA